LLCTRVTVAALPPASWKCNIFHHCTQPPIYGILSLVASTGRLSSARHPSLPSRVAIPSQGFPPPGRLLYVATPPPPQLSCPPLPALHSFLLSHLASFHGQRTIGWYRRSAHLSRINAMPNSLNCVAAVLNSSCVIRFTTPSPLAVQPGT